MSDSRPGVQWVICVEGILDQRASTWFAGFQVSDDGCVTRMKGAVVDQAALYGLLDRIRDLGLSLISVRRFDDEHEGC